jgi:hypothetical protein
MLIADSKFETVDKFVLGITVEVRTVHLISRVTRLPLTHIERTCRCNPYKQTPTGWSVCRRGIMIIVERTTA